MNTNPREELQRKLWRTYFTAFGGLSLAFGALFLIIWYKTCGSFHPCGHTFDLIAGVFKQMYAGLLLCALLSAGVMVKAFRKISK